MQYEALGNKIKAEREKLGLGQEELAKRIERGQQAVSRWEKGASRPKPDDLHRLVAIFQGDINEWLALGGYKMIVPIKPPLELLPLDQLGEETFEGFSRDFIKILNPSVEVYRYGSRGHKQNGVDIMADTEGGLDYQCKRHKDFGPADVAAAVKATTTQAKLHHLLLSRLASSGARDEIKKHDNWVLWDVDDISTKVRNMDIHDAIRLVDNYFPAGFRKAFLGVDDPSPWLTTEEFYRPLMDRERIFNHSWDFVGRKKELRSLELFNASIDVRAAVVSGRGGIGKSRLLRTWAEKTAKSDKVFFLSPGTEVSPKEFEQLSPAKCYLVIDDAHDRSDLLSIFSGIARIRPNTRIIISTRPYGLTRIQDDLTKSGIGYDEDHLVTLGDLKEEEAEALSAEVIEDAHGDTKHAERIAKITKDCPLATVIGSRLVAEGRIMPDVLNNSKKFRNELLRSFRDIVAGDVGGNDADTTRALLNFIAMIQPVDPTDPTFQKAVKDVMKRDFDKISRDLRGLEDAGVLLRRSRKLRIAPDLLADYIRADASYDERNKQPTGYVDRVFTVAKDDLATNLLVNLSQLDWRLSSDDGVQAKLLARVWVDLESQFMAAGIFGRQAILKALAKIAYYQPEQALTFARLAIDNPTEDAEEEDSNFTKGMGLRVSYHYVIDEVPQLLRYVAHHQQYLFEALDILRALADKDPRQPNQYPDHPLRVLRDLATIEPGKPSLFNELILEHTLPWVDDGLDDKLLGFDIFDQLLATEGQQAESQGINLALRPFKINAEAVAALRKKVIDAAFSALLSKDPKKAFRALKTLEHALERPHGIGAMTVTAKDNAAWEPGIVATLERLANLVASEHISPYLTVQLRGYIAGHARWSNGNIRTAADKVLAAIPKNRDNDLARAMADGWGWTFEREGGTMRNEELSKKWKDELATQIIRDFNGNFSKLIDILETNAKTMTSLPLQNGSDYGPFLASLMQQSVDFAKALTEHLINNVESPLLGAFPIAITVLAKSEHAAAIDFAVRAEASGSVQLARCASRALAWSLWDIPISGKEKLLAGKLAANSDVAVRHNIVRIVKRFGNNKDEALELLTSIRIDDNKDVAEEVLGEFSSHGAFKVTELSQGQLEKLLTQLVNLDSIEGYEIETFMSELSAVSPERVVKLLTDRIENKEANYREDDFDNKFKPLPYIHQGGSGLRVAETKEYEALLRAVRDWAAEKTDNWVRAHYGADLFKMVSAGYDKTTLKILGEWINSGDIKKLEAAAALLSEAPNTFAFMHSDYVVNTLEQANKLGKGCFDRVSSWLYGAAISGGRTGVPGRPFPQDIEMRDKSYEIMSNLPVGSAGYKFYKLLNEAAKSNIERDTINDEDLMGD